MGDRCYMQVTCRKEDEVRFAGLIDEQVEEDSDHPHLISMSAGECNYGYCCLTDEPDMPTDIPYYGVSGSGDNYGAGEFACDGQGLYMHVSSTGDGCYVVSFDETTGLANSDSIARVGIFIRFRNSIKKMLEEQKVPA